MKLSQLLSLAVLVVVSACSGTKQNAEEEIVNLYSHRHYDADKELYKKFEETTGIKVNIVQASADEFFVSEQAARQGVSITNRSKYEPMVILKHFGPNHSERP